MRIALLIGACLVASCGTRQPDAAPAAKPEPEPGRLVDGLYYVEAGAPDPLACQKDDDCTGDTVTDATGCCISSPNPWPQTKAWHTWLSQRRQGAACGIKCPPLPIPAEPPRCSFDVSCKSGRCANSCQ